MNIQSSYIFLRKQQDETKIKQNKDGVTELDLGHSVYSILKQSLGLSKSDVIRNKYYKKDIKTIINVYGIDFQVTFSIHEVVENTYLDIGVSYKSKAKAIECMEYINQILNCNDFEKYYIVVISYDAISEYYCNKIYPKLNELERTLRKLLFNIYIVNFGKAYYTKTVNPELQKKVKGVVQAKGTEEKKEIERLKKFFYSLEYIDIQNMLFEERWTEIEKQKKEDFLNNHTDLAELSDEQIRKAFEDISPKSDWERFFEDKLTDIDVKSLINDIRTSRNNIAHCKFFYKHEYSSCLKSITKLKKAIDKAIKQTEEIDFSNKNAERLRDTLAVISKSIAEFQQTIADAITPIIQGLSEFSKALQPTFKSLANLSLKSKE